MPKPNHSYSTGDGLLSVWNKIFTGKVTTERQEYLKKNNNTAPPTPALLCVGHSTISFGHLLPVKNQSFGEWQFRVFESKLQYFFGSAES